jgi:2-dehydropantoate 2-reductase
MKITVFGTGATGGYFGGRLAQGGSDVGFVVRPSQLHAMRTQGLRIESALGPTVLPSVRASDHPADLGTPDLVLVCVKLWDLEDAVREMAPMVGPGTTVVSIQNGVQKDDVLRRAFGERAVLGGVAYISASVPQPGVVRHVGTLQKLVFGEYDGSDSPRVRDFLAACRAGGIDAATSDDIRRAIWEKFVFLVGMSGATTSMRSAIGPIRENPRTRAFLHDLMREVVAVGRANGVRLAEDFADDRLAFCDGLPAEMEASMYADLQRGRRLELPWLSGAAASLGEAAGVPTPANRAVADILALYANGGSAV